MVVLIIFTVCWPDIFGGCRFRKAEARTFTESQWMQQGEM